MGTDTSETVLSINKSREVEKVIKAHSRASTMSQGEGRLPGASQG